MCTRLWSLHPALKTRDEGRKEEKEQRGGGEGEREQGEILRKWILKVFTVTDKTLEKYGKFPRLIAIYA